MKGRRRSRCLRVSKLKDVKPYSHSHFYSPVGFVVVGRHVDPYPVPHAGLALLELQPVGDDGRGGRAVGAPGEAKGGLAPLHGQVEARRKGNAWVYERGRSFASAYSLPKMDSNLLSFPNCLMLLRRPSLPLASTAV